MLNGKLLRERRNQLRLSMRDMAALLNQRSPCSYFRLEHGQSQGDVRQLQMLADILGLSWSELLGPNPAPEPVRDPK